MDFNALYEILAPYIGATGIGTLIVSAFAILVKCSGAIKTFINSFKDTNDMIAENIKKVIPSQLYVKIENVAKSEFAKMKTELLNTVEEKWIEQMKSNTEVIMAIASAMCSMKAVPDSQKELLSQYLNIEPKTTDALVVDIIPNEEIKKSENKKFIIE